MSKQLPNQFYRNLNISQRIRAAWTASLRGDDSELRRIENPNEAGEYEISRVTAALNDLNAVSMAAHLDILSAVTEHLVALIRLEHCEDPKKLHEINIEVSSYSKIPSQISNALNEVCSVIGLEEDSLLSPDSLPPIAKTLIERHRSNVSGDSVEEYSRILLDFLGMRHPRIACFHPA